MTETKWGKVMYGTEMEILGLPKGTEVGLGNAGDPVVRPCPIEGLNLYAGSSYRLHEDHPAYIVHETNKRTGSLFKFHAGGEKPDGEIVRVLLGGGHILRGGQDGWSWVHEGRWIDIIGYELAIEVSKTPVDDHQSDLMSVDSTQADTVTIKRMTEADVEDLWLISNRAGFVRRLRDLGLIREETREEQFTRETGHAVTDAVAAALNWGR